MYTPDEDVWANSEIRVVPGGRWALMLMGGYNLGTKYSCGVLGIGVDFWELCGLLLMLYGGYYARAN